MGKFFAMLKDSLREAIDGWIFTVMLILSALVTLLVLSISYVPVPAEQAIKKLIPEARGPNSGGLQTVSPDRGQGSKLFIYFFNAAPEELNATATGDDVTQSKMEFVLKITSLGMGGMEVGADKQPKGGFDVQNLFRDPFKEAVRTWASPTTGDKVAFTHDLAREFLKTQLRATCRLNVTEVKHVAGSNYKVTAEGVTTRLAWPHKPSLFFGAVPMGFLELPLGVQIHLIEDTLINGLGAWVVLMAGVIVTAGFIPNMVRKGAVDLLITKPMSRPAILFYKYLGGLTFVFLLALVAYGGIWVAIGLRTGIWAPGILYCIPGVTFYFAILYAFSTLLGVVTRNALVSILLTIGFWFVVWIIGTVHNTLTVLDNLEIKNMPARAGAKADPKKAEKAEKVENDEKAADEEERNPNGPPKPPARLVSVFKILNSLTPRTKDLSTLTSNLISRDLLSEGEQRQEGMKLREINWYEVLGVAGVYIVVFLGIAMLRFTTRSY